MVNKFNMIMGQWWNLLTGETEVLREKLRVEQECIQPFCFYMSD